MDRNDEIALNDRKSLRMVRRVTWLGFGVNAALGVLKVAAGILGRSSAMVADGIHSFSDFISDIIVLVFVGISRRKANMEFQYGHGKFETFATMLLALVLGIVGVMFFIEGGEKVWWSFHGAELGRKGAFGSCCGKCVASPQRFAVVACDSCRYRWCYVSRGQMAHSRSGGGDGGERVYNYCGGEAW